MIASFLLLLVGTTDAVRSGGWPRGARRAALGLSWLVLAVLGVWGLGLAGLPVLSCLVLAAVWTLLMPVDDGPRPRRLWPAVILVVLVAVGASYGAAADESGLLADLYADTRLDVLGSVSLSSVVAAVAVAVFLTVSGNIIARAALGRALQDDARTVPAAPRAWELRIRGRRVGSVEPPAHPEARDATLRGGRLIGPLERLLIVLLALGGAQAIIAAVLAAKGIVRFPEISEDRRSGSKAEEFLIGSLASWALAAAAVVYLKALA
ncbi:hypothetical protein [Georgenia yuyongxinii]|uniref:Uncharacterized protein n=1 Tax=Georgenia yuyongxinii TaxID=2589797 RepID=A0A552WJU9_9MICO|nr:hypothetical protein [Georgenia yuyongxinii]TRW43017.1 hypothetical protein FJ693_19305 [Georgenia yuyongxinii]